MNLISAIKALLSEAASAGDLAMVQTCRRALSGDDAALDVCARVIRDAQACDDDQS
jgi:hypothetical protein